MTQALHNPRSMQAATARKRWAILLCSLSLPGRGGRTGSPFAARPSSFAPSGLALLEVMLALGVFVVAAVFVLDSLSGALRGVRTAQLEADAADIAVTVTSQMQIGQIERVSAGPIAMEMPGYEQWTWQATFEGLEDRLDLPQLKKLTITVRSEADGFEHSVTQFVWDNPNPPAPPPDASQLAQAGGGDLSALQSALGGAAAGGGLPGGSAAPGNSANGGGFPGIGGNGAGFPGAGGDAGGNAGANGFPSGMGRGVSRPGNGARQAPGGFNTGNIPRSGDGFKPGSNVPRSGDGFRPPQLPAGADAGNLPRGGLPRGAEGFRPGQNTPRNGDGFRPPQNPSGGNAPRSGDGFRPPQNPSGGNTQRSGDGFRPGQNTPRNGDGFKPGGNTPRSGDGFRPNTGNNANGNRPTPPAPPANRPTPPAPPPAPPTDVPEDLKDKSKGGGQ